MCAAEVQERGSSIWKHPHQDADVPAAGWAAGLAGSCSSSDPKTHVSCQSPLTLSLCFSPYLPNSIPLFLYFPPLSPPFAAFLTHSVPCTLSLSLPAMCPFSRPLCLFLPNPCLDIPRSSSGKKSLSSSIWVFYSRQNVPKERGGREESYLRMHSIVILPPFDRWTEKEKIISPLNSWNSQDTEMK